MTKIKLHHPGPQVSGVFQIPGSKSETNRLQILRKLYFPELQILNPSLSNDSKVLEQQLATDGVNKNVGDAGTAMRFLTAYASAVPGLRTRISGSPRMHDRPIGVLVKALRKLGAVISYEHTEAYPPLTILGNKLQSKPLEIDAGISSQFISALIMIGPTVTGGLQLNLKGKGVSRPYINMTVGMMKDLGFEITVEGNVIRIPEGAGSATGAVAVGGDWSAASYWYLIACLASDADLRLKGLELSGLQGDEAVKEFFEPLGVSSFSDKGEVALKKGPQKDTPNEIDLLATPDLAQTLIVALAAQDRRVTIRGLQTLRIKETDRLRALKIELEKAGAEIQITEDSLTIKHGIRSVNGITFDTYGDHRMAMAFAPLALLDPIVINEPEVVEKSYPVFWSDLEAAGFALST